MSRLKIINSNDIKAFDSPPVFNGEERKRFFCLPQWASELVERFRTPTNKIGFILQFGYFKATNRFFVARKYHQQESLALFFVQILFRTSYNSYLC